MGVWTVWILGGSDLPGVPVGLETRPVVDLGVVEWPRALVAVLVRPNHHVHGELQEQRLQAWGQGGSIDVDQFLEFNP